MGGCEIAISQAPGEDGFGLLAVQIEAFRLLVLFVPGETQPAQSFEDRLNAGLSVALDIGVIETQDHGSMVVAGIKPIENERTSAAYVEKTSGRRRKTNARQCSF